MYEKNITFFPVAIYDSGAVLGPLWSKPLNTCLDCVFYNDVAKEIVDNEDKKRYRSNYKQIWIEFLFLFLTNEMLKFKKTGYTVLFDSIYLINSHTMQIKKFNVIKYASCKQCSYLYSNSESPNNN